VNADGGSISGGWSITFNDTFRQPAALPTALTYQGRLEGVPPDGTAFVRFSLWDHLSSTNVANRVALAPTSTVTLAGGLLSAPPMLPGARPNSTRDWRGSSNSCPARGRPRQETSKRRGHLFPFLRKLGHYQVSGADAGDHCDRAVNETRPSNGEWPVRCWSEGLRGT